MNSITWYFSSSVLYKYPQSLVAFLEDQYRIQEKDDWLSTAEDEEEAHVPGSSVSVCPQICGLERTRLCDSCEESGVAV